MRSVRLGSGMALGLFLAIGCHDNTGLRSVPDAGRNGGAGGVAAGTGGLAGTGGGLAGTGGGAGASATGGSGAGGTVGTDAAANPDTNARADAGPDARDGTGVPDAANDRSLIDVGAPDAKDAPAGEAQRPVDSGTAESGGLDAGSVCSEVPCLAAILLPCQPAAPCTSAQSGTTAPAETTNTCYANGVKHQSVSRLVGNDFFATLTGKRETGVCYTIEVSLSLASTPTTALYVFRDGAGNQVATGTAEVNTDVVIVTCNGGTPTPLSQACQDTASTSSACTDGPCTY